MHRHPRSNLAIVMLVTLLGSIVGMPRPAAAAAQWYAEYFTNMNLSGGPALTRYETDVNHEWGTGSPGDGIPADGFSARFTQDIWFEGGTYRFDYRSDDGLRIFINNALVVDYWGDHAASWSTNDAYVPPGVNQVRIEYYEHWGEAALQLGWEKLQSSEVWDALFWNNMTLSGDAVLGRKDAAIDFDWGTGSPDPKVPADNFSARWGRTLGFEAGTYRFYASSDDGVRIYVDGNRIVDSWMKQKLPNTHYADITLSAGNHNIAVDYFEDGGNASIHVWWNRVDAVQGWEGKYYDNRELRGGPAMIRGDAEINFDWGEGAPATWIPSDNFSVQWVRTINFQPGLYRFNTRSDDGMRLWIDDVNLWMNYWDPQELTWRYQGWTWLEGTHTLRVEYFEATGSASMQFWWDYAPTEAAAGVMSPSPTYGFPVTAAPVPPATPTTGTSAGAQAVQLPGPWTGEYFATRDLSGTPTVVRTDTAINFDWGWDAPATGLPVNNFAVRWTGTFAFDEGRYRITTTTDDGVRVYVDDRLVINSWWPMRGSRYATVDLTQGQHTVRMEYFEATQAAKAKLTWQRLSP